MSSRATLGTSAVVLLDALKVCWVGHSGLAGLAGLVATLSFQASFG